jgi:hypothetical protein
MRFVSAATFIPKSKVRGSCDPHAMDRTEHKISLMESKWGITATWERMKQSNVPRFTFPLVITQVDPGSEAHHHGLKQGDQIVAAGHAESPFGIMRVQVVF